MDRYAGVDQQVLRRDQYANAGNLDARSGIYDYAEPRPSLQEFAVGLVPEGLAGKAVLDVGCGPGSYAPVFGTAAFYAGFDLSEGMVTEARQRNAVRDVAVMDAQFLPVRDDAFDVVLAMHMLYHVPDRTRAIDELARVVRSDGVVLVVTNTEEHQRETRAVVAAAYERVTGRAFAGKPVDVNFDAERAPDELRRRFSVAVNFYGTTLAVPAADPVVAYVGSMRSFVGLDDEHWPVFLDTARELVGQTIATDGAFHITTNTSVMACRPLVTSGA